MSNAVVVVVDNTTPYTLSLVQPWKDSGGTWTTEPPKTIPPDGVASFVLASYNNGGVVYLAEDATGDQFGYVTMSFTCPLMLDNKAEGSPATLPGIFIPAGLQPYKRRGHPLELSYRVGEDNRACWHHGDETDDQMVCAQTRMQTWATVLASVVNMTQFDLKCAETWNHSWVRNAQPVALRPLTRRIFMLNSNSSGGIRYQVLDGDHEIGYATMSMACPSDGENTAEGSPSTENIFVPAGLQRYDVYGTPAYFTYHVGNANLACWRSGSSNDGNLVCDWTKLNGRAKVVVINDNHYDLEWVDKWGSKDDWYFQPDGAIPAGSHKLLVFNGRGRAGVRYTAAGMPFHLSFTCPLTSSNSAEGSPFSGLQTYSMPGTPVTFTYRIGIPNEACWNNGSWNDGRLVCNETRAKNILPVWMGTLNASNSVFGTLELGEVFWPGTHDSACYAIPPYMPAWFIKTQFLSFLGQLKAGVRYFDLRLKWIDKRRFQFHHGPGIDVYLEALLEALETYYADSSHEKEIVILDFTHFENFDSTEKYQDFVNTLLTSSIRSKLARMGNSSRTLESLWSANETIVASVDYGEFAKLHTSNLVWNGRTLFADGWSGTKFWPDTSSVSTMVSKLEELLAEDYNGRLWVLQNILTADGLHWSIQNLSREANPSLVRHLLPGTPWFTKTNIAIIDYFGDDGMVSRDDRDDEGGIVDQLTVYAQYVNWQRASMKAELQEHL